MKNSKPENKQNQKINMDISVSGSHINDALFLGKLTPNININDNKLHSNELAMNSNALYARLWHHTVKKAVSNRGWCVRGKRRQVHEERFFRAGFSLNKLNGDVTNVVCLVNAVVHFGKLS